MRRILVVEDDSDIARDLQTLLEEEGFAVTLAGNGRVALDLLQSADSLPHLLLLDLMMPVMNGFEFLEERQKIPKLSKLPIVVMTAGAFAELDKTAAGIQAFVRKPIDLDRFLETVQKSVASEV